MRLIFAALAGFIVLMVLSTGIGISWLSTSVLESAKQESVKSLATGLTYSISSQMRLFEQTVSQIAADEDVIMAIASQDSALMKKTADKMQKFLPVALKLRLLPATVNSIDESETPVMGYADLEMVKKTLTAKQLPFIQGEGSDRHLAVTATVTQNSQVIGIVLASLKFDFLTEILSKAPINDNYIEISQDTVMLGSSGDSSLKTDSLEKVQIPNSAWQIAYAVAGTHSFSDVGASAGLIIVIALLTCAALFLGYYYVSNLLKKDQNTVLEAVKNLMTGKELTQAEVKLTEMQVIISTLVQFKRIMDNKEAKSSTETAEKSKGSDFIESLLADKDETGPDFEKSMSSLLKKKN